ncbi:nitrate/nitrite transporter NrtS [Halospina denitrificans]|nr:nitrate/nitrite transporter NrtS [Halospina denitrificans]
MTHGCSEALRLALTGGTPARAAWVAAVVGTILVVINQWEALLGMQALSIPKLVLTYVVPYLVSTYTAVSKDLRGRNIEPW